MVSQLLPLLVLVSALSPSGATSSTDLASAASASFQVDLLGVRHPFAQPWEGCIGSGHALLSLRADWRAHLARCAQELGVRRVRFHGLMDDDMSTSLGLGQPSYVNLDSLIDYTASIGVTPLFELGFMPSWLASDPDNTSMHYKGIVSPPRNYSQWGEVMEDLARHMLTRYGEETVSTWLLEVWNEPNGGFWTGFPKQSTYFKLYKETADAFGRVSPRFQIGGPATAGCPGWIEDLKNFTSSTNTTMSFASCHVYGGGSDPASVGVVSAVVDSLPQAKTLAGDIPLIITEWSSSWMYTVPFHDEPGSAAFIAATAAAASGLADVMSYWTFSDVFEEGGMLPGSFHGGFGLLTVHGTPKPAYRAFQLLHQAGGARLNVTKEAGGCGDVNLLALVNSSAATLFIYNHLISGQAGSNCTASIHLGAAAPPGLLMSAKVARIDAANANPKAAFLALGAPEYPTAEQLAQLEIASTPVWMPLHVDGHVAGTSFELMVPGHGLAVVSMPLI